MRPAGQFSDLRISASAVSLMQRCPRAWAYRYMRGVAAEDITANQILGSGLHEALASFYAAMRDGHLAPTASQMLDVVVAAFDETELGPLPVIFDAKETRATVIADARRLLTVFLVSGYRPKRVIAVEAPFELPVLDPTGQQMFEEVIVGVFDLVAEEADGTLSVVDHKSRKRRSAEIELQMLLYAGAAARLYPEYAQQRILHQTLLRQKVASVEITELPCEPADLIEGREAILSGLTLAHAAVGHSVPLRLLGRRRGWHCKNCAFRRRCTEELTTVPIVVDMQKVA
jgi:putative RecB family exonuclease